MAQYLVMALVETELGGSTVEDHARLALMSNLAFEKTGKVAVQVIFGIEGLKDEEEPEDLNEVVYDLQEELAKN